MQTSLNIVNIVNLSDRCDQNDQVDQNYQENQDDHPDHDKDDHDKRITPLSLDLNQTAIIVRASVTTQPAPGTCL